METTLSLNLRIHPFTCRNDPGAFDRCVDLVREIQKAALWNGEGHIWITDPYEMHRKVKGPEHLPITALRFESQSDGVYVSLPSTVPFVVELKPEPDHNPLHETLLWKTYDASMTRLLAVAAKHDFTPAGDKEYREANSAVVEAFNALYEGGA